MMTLDPKRRLKRPMVYELVPGIMTVEYDPDALKSGDDPWKILNIVIKVAERHSLAVLVDFGNLEHFPWDTGRFFAVDGDYGESISVAILLQRRMIGGSATTFWAYGLITKIFSDRTKAVSWLRKDIYQGVKGG